MKSPQHLQWLSFSRTKHQGQTFPSTELCPNIPRWRDVVSVMALFSLLHPKHFMTPKSGWFHGQSDPNQFCGMTSPCPSSLWSWIGRPFYPVVEKIIVLVGATIFCGSSSFSLGDSMKIPTQKPFIHGKKRIKIHQVPNSIRTCDIWCLMSNLSLSLLSQEVFHPAANSTYTSWRSLGWGDLSKSKDGRFNPTSTCQKNRENGWFKLQPVK